MTATLFSTKGNLTEAREKIELLLGMRPLADHAGLHRENESRPATKVYADQTHVLKLRSEYRLAQTQAERFIHQCMEREQALAIYHPDKIWFHISLTENDVVEIGNLTPLLTPVSAIFQEAQAANTYPYIELVKRMLDMYFTAAQNHNYCLDMGLSNFGVDTGNILYYIDDEVYSWDDYNTLPEFLASLIRTQLWLLEVDCRELGRWLRLRLLAVSGDPHILTIVTEAVRRAYFASDRHQLLQILVDALYAGAKYQPTQRSVTGQHQLLGLIADIHANAPALEVALTALKKRGVDHILILGDIVGYGPHPEDCAWILSALPNMSAIRGNHDHAVATGKWGAGLNSMAAWVLQWTLDNISSATQQWLASLPAYIRQENWLAVHGSPIDKTFFNGYVYQMSFRENLDALEQRKITTCFHGHTHIQSVYARRRGIDAVLPVTTVMDLVDYNHTLICPGSVGQPRGHHPGVECATFHTGTNRLELLRLDYAMEKTLNDMKTLQFPDALLQRIRLGN